MSRRAVLKAAFGAALGALLAVGAAEAGTILVKPGKLDHFLLTAPPTGLAGENFLVRVEPYDVNNNLITEFRGKAGVFSLSVSGGGEVSPAKLRAEEFAGGATVKVASKRAGILELTVTEGEGATPLASVQVRVLPNRLDRFVVNVPREVTAGENFQARVIAQDAFGNTKDDLADIREGLRVEILGTGTAVSTDKTLPGFRGGEAIFSFQPRKAGSLRVAVQETRTRSAGESPKFEVIPAALARFIVLGPKTTVAGEKFIVLVSAYDAFENPLTNYEARGEGLLLQPSGTGSLAPTAVPAKTFQDGQARVTLTYTKAEALRVTVREQNRETAGESEAILVTPSDPEHFRVSTPPEAIAGEGFAAQLEALDRFGNLIEDYDLRGFEVLLSTDGRGQLSPAAVSPAAFVRGKATVTLLYNRAESFTVVAALSKESLEKLVAERKRQAATPPAPAISPEELAQERERAAASRAREEAQRAKSEAEKGRVREEAVKARQEAEQAREQAAKAPKPAPAKPEAGKKPGPAPSPAAKREPATPAVKVLEKAGVEVGADQVILRLTTSGPVSYNASTGSRLSKEWIWLELFPVRVDPSLGQSVPVSSPLVGEILVEQPEPEKARISLQVLPPGISYVVTQQDRAVVVKIIRTE